MKKYEKPQITKTEFEVRDIIASSNIFEDIADVDKVGAGDFEILIGRDNW